LLVVNKNLFYQGRNQSTLNIDTNNIVINNKDYYFTSSNRIFFLNYITLTEIKNVDFSTFKKIDKSTYEDKNNMYEKIQ
jgi:uncharacterized membrane protein